MGSWNIKKILKEAIIVMSVVFVAGNVISFLRKPSLPSDRLPNMQSRLIDGSILNQDDVLKKPLIVHFWGTWCPTCKLEASNIQAVSKKYRVLSIAVNSGSDEQIKQYMNEKDLNFKVINDNEGKWKAAFNVEVFPTTFIYDSKGKLQFTEVGYTTTAGLLARMMAVK
ncbi:MAG TPA: protein disulfide oxidoreductase [Sulfurovum sp. UBA12169]|nr:MAG TPA: protein disulfide oxidoreductase [Sulfurovum sp. UBA12169]